MIDLTPADLADLIDAAMVATGVGELAALARAWTALTVADPDLADRRLRENDDPAQRTIVAAVEQVLDRGKS